jgi:hypothetical protein
MYVTGDVHGYIGVKKFNMDNFPVQDLLTKDDYVVVCGDFGFVWDNSKTDKYWQQWLRERNFTLLFVDGNHENFHLLNSYPVEEWNGGKVHKINDSIIHLMRGQVFNIKGKKIFTFGGATSVDKEYRRENISWWPEEIPNAQEFEEGLVNLEKNNWEVDYIFSHCCSSQTLKLLTTYFRLYDFGTDNLNQYFDLIEEKVKYKHWYFGHYHWDVVDVVDNHSVLYNLIIKI